MDTIAATPYSTIRRKPLRYPNPQGRGPVLALALTEEKHDEWLHVGAVWATVEGYYRIEKGCYSRKARIPVLARHYVTEIRQVANPERSTICREF